MWRQAIRACSKAASRSARPAGVAAACRCPGRQLAAAAAATHGGQSASSGLWVLAAAAAFAGAASVALAQPAREQSFIMVKPDGVQRGKVADIIRRFEVRGFKLVGIKASASAFPGAGSVPLREHRGKPSFDRLVAFLSSGPVVAMVWEGDNLAAVGRSMLGATKPQQSAPGTIRGDLGILMGRNLCHAFDSPESAPKEIALWFRPEELAQYELCTEQWTYEY